MTGPGCDDMNRELEINRAVAEVLGRPDLNGVYRVSQSGCAVQPILDGRTLADKQSLLAGIAQALEFPDYFGANWDALEECLGDMSWREGRICLLIEHADAIPEALLNTLLAIFSAQAEQWASEGRVCSLFLCGLDDTKMRAAINAEIPLLA